MSVQILERATRTEQRPEGFLGLLYELGLDPLYGVEEYKEKKSQEFFKITFAEVFFKSLITMILWSTVKMHTPKIFCKMEALWL